MTIDEAIKHAEEQAIFHQEKLEYMADAEGNYKYIENVCSQERKCAEEHRQLADWLKELRAYKKTYPFLKETYGRK